MAQRGRVVKIFCSYAQEDLLLLNQLKTHLSTLERSNNVELWDDGKIQPGEVWKEQTQSHLDDADIILLLVSADFLASDLCYDVEMRRALERQGKGEISVLPIILRFCLWQKTPLDGLQALPRNAKPVDSWENRDRAWTDVAAGIQKVVDMLLGNAPTNPAPQAKSTSSITPFIYGQHTARVNAATWSPDGKWIASASDDRSVRIWNASDGIRLQYHQFSGAVRTVVWSPNGKWIAATAVHPDLHEELCLYAPETDTQKRIGPVVYDSDLSWSPDGNSLAFITHNKDKDSRTLYGIQIKTIPLLSSFFRTKFIPIDSYRASLAWSSDGKKIACGQHDGTVLVFNAAVGRKILTYTHHEAIDIVRWSSGGRYIHGLGRETELLIDMQTRTIAVKHLMKPRRNSPVEWSPDGKHFVSLDGSNKVAVFPAEAYKPRTPIQPTRWEDVESHRIRPKSRISRRTMIVGSTIAILAVGSIGAGSYAIHRFSPPSPLLIYSGHSGAVRAIAWSPSDGKYIASGSDDKTIQIWEATTGKKIFTYSGHSRDSGGVGYVAWSPDGKQIASAGADSLQVWEAATGKTLITRSSTGPVAWSPDGQQIASGVSGGIGGNMQIWEVSTGNAIHTYHTDASPLGSIAWSPIERSGLVASGGGYSGKVQIWSVSTEKSIFTFDLGLADGIAWSPDGQHLAVAGESYLQIWSTTTGKMVLGESNTTVFPGEFTVDWAPHGQYVVSGGAQKIVQVWNAANGNQVAAYPGHTDYILSVAWSPNSTSIASASSDHTVRIWQAP